jgi:peptide-methionine (S)-S-oxide reductase
MSEDQPNEPARSDDVPQAAPVERSAEEGTSANSTAATELATATFGAGCFWCVEAVFQQLDGVESVESGYMGGHTKNPSYQQVCSGLTGHAEVCQIKYDPAKIGFDELLAVFWKTHDPTTLNRQGNDFGTQYRSAVFFHNEQQKELAEKYKRELDESGAWPNPIVTEITAASEYYKAEDYHQNYFNTNPNDRYCNVMIPPKLEKLRKVFGDKLKPSAKAPE